MNPYCYFFGFGSLLFPAGYLNRRLKHPPNILHNYYELKFHKRGMFGIWKTHKKLHSYFGMIEDPNSSVVGAVAPIMSLEDLRRLLLNEGALASRRCPTPVYQWKMVGKFRDKPLITLISNSLIAKDYLKVRPAHRYLEYVFSRCDQKYKEILYKEISDVIKKYEIKV